MSRWHETSDGISYEGRSTSLDDAALKAILTSLLAGRSNKHIRRRHGVKSTVLRDIVTKFKEWLEEESNA